MPTHPVRLRTSQLVVGVFIASVVVISAVFALVLQTRDPVPVLEGPDQPGAIAPTPDATVPLAIAAVVLGVGAVVLAFALRRPFVRRAQRRWRGEAADARTPAPVLQAFQTMSVLRAGAAELFGLCCALAFFITGRPAFLIGAALAVVLLIALVPKLAGYRAFHREATGEDPGPLM